MLKTVPAFDRIGEENAFAVLARANALAAQGRDIINLGIGQPDFRTPDFIVEAAIKALRDGHHGYTPAVGITPLREAVAADLGKRFKVSVSPVAGLEKFPDVAVMSDEIYDHMVYDGEMHVCLLTYPSIRDRLILLNGWSKTYAMTGWRLGYAIWPGKLYDYARKLAVNLHSCVNASAQFAGLAALKGPQDEVTKMVAEFDKRRKVVVDGLNKLPGGLVVLVLSIPREGGRKRLMLSTNPPPDRSDVVALGATLSLSKEKVLMRQSCRDFVDDVVFPFIRHNWQREWVMTPEDRLP